MPPPPLSSSGCHSQLVGSCLPAISLGSVLPCSSSSGSSSSSNSSSCSSLVDRAITESRARAPQMIQKVIDDETCQRRGDHHHSRVEPSIMMTRQRAASLLKTKPEKPTAAGVKNCWSGKKCAHDNSRLGKQRQKNLDGRYSKPLTASSVFHLCRSSLRLKNTLAASNRKELCSRAKVLNLFKAGDKSAKKTVAEFKCLSGNTVKPMKPRSVVSRNSFLNEQKLTEVDDLKTADNDIECSRVFTQQVDDSCTDDDSALSDDSLNDCSAGVQPLECESPRITRDALINSNFEDAENESDGAAQQTAASTAAVIAADAVDERMLINSSSVTCQLSDGSVVNSDVMQNSSLPHCSSIVQATGSLACADDMPLLTLVRNGECSALLSPPSMVSSPLSGPLSCITLVPALNSGLNLVQDAVHSSLYLSSASSYLVKTNAIVYLKHSNSVQMSQLSTNLQMAPTTHHSLLSLSTASQSLHDVVTLSSPAPMPHGVVALPAISTAAHGVEVLFPSPMPFETVNIPHTQGPHELLTLSSVDPMLGIVALSSNQPTHNLTSNMSPLVHVPASPTLVTLSPSPAPEGLLTIVPNLVLPSFPNLNLSTPLTMNNRSSVCFAVRNVDSFQAPYWSSSSQASSGCEGPSSAVVCLMSDAIDSIASSPVVIENVRPTMSDSLKSCLVGSSSGMPKNSAVATLVGLNMRCALMLLSPWDLSCPSARLSRSKACASMYMQTYFLPLSYCMHCSLCFIMFMFTWMC